MASRRDSRVHISVKHNDALLEFENFKRKYLLVNKHITKLNSTLSVRVEELNAQISSLYVENLRLRASEVSLASQLKREKECSQRIVAEAQSAVGTLMRHLTGIRTSLDRQTMESGPSSPPTRRKLPSSPVQPPRETVRLVRPPAETITQIRESDEDDMDYDDDDVTPTRVVAARRPSTSRLPLPLPLPKPASDLAAPFPRPSAIPHINLEPGATKRKVGRRNSALLHVEHVHGVERAPSPVARSMKRGRRSSLEEEREVELEVQVGVPLHVVSTAGQDEELQLPGLVAIRKPGEKLRKVDREGKGREPLREWEHEPEPHSASERESSEGAKEKDKRRFGIKDVTNSPRKPLCEFADEKPADEPGATLSTPSSTRTPLFDTLTPRPSTSLLPSAASTPATDGGSEGGEGTGGRERRTRRSVNYAEPKLNTKMRKPDLPPETVSKPRASASAVVPRRRKSITPSPLVPSDEEGDADVEGSGSGIRWTEGRRKTVYAVAVNAPGVPSVGGGAATVNDDPYGMRVDGRRHSMAV